MPTFYAVVWLDHPSKKQWVVVLARQFFLKHDRMAGAPGAL